MITYDHTGERLEAMIDELWEHEENYLSHKEILLMARMHFKQGLRVRPYDAVRDHYNEVIGQ